MVQILTPAQALEIMGGALAGHFLSCITLGLITYLSYSYFLHFSSDPLYLRVIVILLWVMQAGQVVMVSNSLWHYLILHHGNYFALEEVDWSFVGFDVFAVSTTLLVQLFYTMRIYRLSYHNIWLTGAVLLLVLAQAGLGFVCTSLFAVHRHFLVFITRFSHWGLIWLISGAVADVFVTICMCWLLHRQRTGYSQSDGMITRLIFFTLNTGLVTSVIALILSASYATRGFNFLTLFFFTPYGLSYFAAMLTNLTSRSKLRDTQPKQNTPAGSSTIKFKRPSPTAGALPRPSVAVINSKQPTNNPLDQMYPLNLEDSMDLGQSDLGYSSVDLKDIDSPTVPPPRRAVDSIQDVHDMYIKNRPWI